MTYQKVTEMFRNAGRGLFLLAVVGTLVLSGIVLGAQTLNPPVTDPGSLRAENEALRNLIQQLQEQVGALRNELAAAQAKVRPTVEAEKSLSGSAYASLYQKAKADARQACKDAGGKLWVMVQSPGTPQQAIAISCELK